MDYFNIQGINNPQISLRKVLDYEAMNFMEFTLRAMVSFITNKIFACSTIA